MKEDLKEIVVKKWGSVLDLVSKLAEGTGEDTFVNVGGAPTEVENGLKMKEDEREDELGSRTDGSTIVRRKVTVSSVGDNAQDGVKELLELPTAGFEFLVSLVDTGVPMEQAIGMATENISTLSPEIAPVGAPMVAGKKVVVLSSIGNFMLVKFEESGKIASATKSEVQYG